MLKECDLSLRGQSSPGTLQSGQHPSKAWRQIPQLSSGASQVHVATACQLSSHHDAGDEGSDPHGYRSYIHLCINTDVYISVYIYTHICMHIYVYTHIYTHIYIQICIHTHKCTHIYEYIYIHMYISMYIYIHIYIFLCIYKHTYIYMMYELGRKWIIVLRTLVQSY